jgi:hypothetical protein
MEPTVKEIRDHKAGFCRPLAGFWSEQEAHRFAREDLGLLPNEYTLSFTRAENESDSWPD